MKYFAFSVYVLNANDDSNEYFMVAAYNDVDFARIKEYRRFYEELVPKVKETKGALHRISCWVMNARWVRVEENNYDHEQLLAALDNTSNEQQVIEITEAQYCDALEDEHNEDEPNELRTEFDFVHITDKGIAYTCEEKYGDQHFETHTLFWYQLFNEAKPAPPEVLSS